MRIPGAILAVSLTLASATLCACSGGMDVWERPYVAAHRSPPAPASPRTARPAAADPLPPPAYQPSPEPAPAASPVFGDPAAPCGDAPTAEDRATFDEVNRVRATRGLRAFRWDAKLFKAALDHSREQDRHGYMGHGSPDPRRDDLGDRVRIAGYRPRAWAEVVAWGYRGPRQVVQGWMDSKGHREILTDPALVDAGFSRVGDYFTGDFGTPLPARTIAPAPSLRSCAPAPSH